MFEIQGTPIEDRYPLPLQFKPIYIIGAGAIVRDAHLPAYRIAGYQVAGIVDLDQAKARQLAEQYGIAMTYPDVASMVADAPADCIYDMALPGSLHAGVLKQLPDQAAVLLQKPMGETLEQARGIVAICREKQLLAAVNFQLRFAPFMIAAKQIIDQGLIGEVNDMEVRVTVDTPWATFDFLKAIPRVEILYHSVHYIDCIRHFCGEPSRIMGLALPHPGSPEFADLRSTLLLDYGPRKRVTISTNHNHSYGLDHQQAYVKWEGSKGAIYVKLGLLMNYPHGVPDQFEYCLLKEGEAPRWESVAIDGTWFPHAFIGSMGQLMHTRNGDLSQLVTGVEDALKTMEWVEQAYQSSAGQRSDS